MVKGCWGLDVKGNKPIRAMVVDDAAFMRKQLVEIISNSDDIDVVGVARHGKEALEAIKRLKPDVITLDVDMPVMDGITTIKNIMIRSPVPVVMVSGLGDQSKITFEALRLGAIDFFPKPSGTISKDIAKTSDKLIRILKIAAKSNPKLIKRAYLSKSKIKKTKIASKNIQGLLIIFAGQGSISGLIRLLLKIGELDNLGILCVQDISIDILKSFGKGLKRFINCQVYDGKKLQLSTRGCILLSEAYLPLLIKDNNGLFLNEKANSLKDFFTSLSSYFSNGKMAISILGGKSPDEIEPYKTVIKKDNEIFLLSPESCPCSELPKMLRDRGIGLAVKDEYEMVQKIKAYSRRLRLDQLCKN